MTVTGPLVTPAQLGTLIESQTIDVARATDIIADVQTLCASVVTLTPECSVVVKRVAARAYVSTVSPRGPQMGAGGSPFGGGSTSPNASMPGGIVLWKSDIRDLRRLSGGSAAYSIDTLADDFTLPGDLPYWDVDAVVDTGGS